MSILVIAELDSHGVKAATRSAITAASQLGEEVHLLLAGSGVEGIAAQVASINGLSKILLADAAEYAHGIAENLTPLLVQLAPSYSAIVAAATSFGKNLLPRAAALLDVAMVSEVIQIIDATTFVRPMYAGNLNATVKAPAGLRILTIRPTVFEAAAAEGGSAVVENIAAAAYEGDTGKATWVSRDLVQLDRPELATARVVISGGRSLGSAEGFSATLTPLADVLGAAIGATRAAVDAGMAPNDSQVGQTGTVVAPELYIAFGVSGAAQHVGGIKDSKVIVAVNHDADAPIFQVADYGLVADLFTVIPELTAALKG
ncbi:MULTISPECIES: FAD-binding protein [Deefgea]|uniref:Electron transfer flavoprotein subunit alpha/FixB family protein n=1 Tax=Deefgea chitinilytica TaxID=570276 RepID=A0ABS2C7I2_9NEIS|nr:MULTISPECIES: FAD-binding protein [Deefgea]MBM5570110.1 electron transfer flavoprotein subunit alpha/FixB family protein [Deefgea chitinilytica]MBM9887339.1 electron transfer flavoprotein subunit alpha/FixB family protein [Deefgea sp. CFH1-16]